MNKIYTYNTTEGSRLEEIDDTLSPSESAGYSYDSIERLTGVTAAAQTSSFSYDDNGNRLMKSMRGVSNGYGYKPYTNWLDTVVTTTNGQTTTAIQRRDDRGNTTFDGKYEYLYNTPGDLVYAGQGLSTLSSATNVQQLLQALSKLYLYRYNVNHQRVSKANLRSATINSQTKQVCACQTCSNCTSCRNCQSAYGLEGKTFLYDIFGNMVRERILSQVKSLSSTATNRTVKSQNYYYAGARLLGMSTDTFINNNTTDTAPPVTYWIHTDHRGAAVATTDPLSLVRTRIAYDPIDPFGAATVTGTGPDLPWRLPNHYRDAETGLYYNWHRYYNPSWGRYMAPDPARTMQPYAYAGNDPVRFIDLTGLAPTRAELKRAELEARLSWEARELGLGRSDQGGSRSRRCGDHADRVHHAIL